MRSRLQRLPSSSSNSDAIGLRWRFEHGISQQPRILADFLLYRLRNFGIFKKEGFGVFSALANALTIVI